MNPPAHPSTVIESALALNLRHFAGEAESNKRVQPQQLETIYRQNWFNMFVPVRFGGLGLSFIDGLKMQEALAWTDGSIGWTITLCSGANYFIGFLQPDDVTKIFGDPSVCLAGSGHPSGVARRLTDGYEITGRWRYATGSPHATVFTAICLLEEEGNLLKDKDGKPLTRAFWFWANEVVVHKDWNAMGMIATASHSFEVKGLQVPLTRVFVIDQDHALLPDPIFRFPFLQFAEATLAINISGMAMRFLDLCKIIFSDRLESKKNDLHIIAAALNKLEKAELEMNSHRAAFYEIAEMSWNAFLSNESYQHSEHSAKLTKISRQLAYLARKQTDVLYPYCGMTAADRSTEINRVWRDLHTASQHELLQMT